MWSRLDIAETSIKISVNRVADMSNTFPLSIRAFTYKFEVSP